MPAGVAAELAQAGHHLDDHATTHQHQSRSPRTKPATAPVVHVCLFAEPDQMAA